MPDSTLSRRELIKTLALSTGALSLPLPVVQAQTPAVPSVPEVHKLPVLGYDYDALEPFIDAETMKLHHDKHHATYVAKLNQAIEKEPSLASRPVEELLKDLHSLPESIRSDVQNHGGGHFNHSLLWQSLRKKEGDAPSGPLAKALNAEFGSRAGFEEKLQAAALKVFGSGWAWLVLREGRLTVESTPNQDSPLFTGGIPLLGIDVWEHAYYLKYQNRRADYLKAFTQIINWDFVGERYRRFKA
jgi:Fe-Mn family superoxide dismutase